MKPRMGWLVLPIVLGLFAMALPCPAQTENKGAPASKAASRKAAPKKAARKAGPEAPSTGPIVLGGRVTDEAGKPLEGASVSLQGAGYLSARTDAGGRYAFRKIEKPGQYRIGVSAKGHVGLTDYAKRPVVLLDPNSRLVKDFTLQTGCTVNLEVVDEEEKPVKGIRVIATEVGGGFRHPELGQGSTGADGKATLGGIPASEAQIIITALSTEDYASEKLITKLSDPKTTQTAKIVMKKGVEVKGRALCSDGKPAAGWSVMLQPDWWATLYMPKSYPIDAQGNFTLQHVTPGNYSVNIYIPRGEGGGMSFQVTSAQLPPREGLLEFTVPRPSPGSQVAITGAVTIKGGEVKQGINISAQSASGSSGDTYFNTGRSSRPRRPGEKAAADEFKIEGLQPGVYDLHFYSIEIGEKTIKGVKAPSSDLAVELEFRAKPHLRGQVVSAATAAPLTHYRARVRKLQTLSGPNYVPDGNWMEVDNPKGMFDLETVGPGVYQVQAAAEGLARTWSREINTDTDASKTLTILLGPGAGIRGRVVNEAGQPVRGAKVIPLSTGGGTMSSNVDTFTSEEGAATTADNGEFALDHLTSGTETLKTIHPDYCFTITDGIALSDGKTTSGVAITLREGGTVEGHVYDPEGKPQAHAALSFQDQSGYSGSYDVEYGRLATVVTDEQGFYRARHLPEQLCYVNRTERWNSNGVVSLAIVPVNGKTRTLDLGGGPCQVSGRLLQEGKPLSSQRLVLSGNSPYFGVFIAYAVTDAKGAFCFRGVAPGRRTLYAPIPGERSEYIPLRKFEVLPGAASLDLGDLAPPDGRVTITVSGGDPKLAAAPPAVRVAEMLDDDNYGNSAGQVQPRTDPKGPTVVTSLAPGRYAAMVQLSPFVTLRRFFTLEAGQREVKLDVKIPACDAMLDGFYLLKERLSLYLISEDKSIMAYIPLEKEHYLVDGVPAGNYQICESTAGGYRPLRKVTLKAHEAPSVDIAGPEWIQIKDCMLRVNTLSAEGVPLSGVKLWLEAGGNTLKPVRELDWNAAFSGKEGEYTLHATYPGYRAVTVPVRLAPETAAEKKLTRRDDMTGATVLVLEREP